MIYTRLKLNYSGFALDVDLQLPGRGVTALYGHSGSGKTTCLRCIAGLEHAEEGFIQVNDEVWQDSAKRFSSRRTSAPSVMSFKKRACFHTCRYWPTWSSASSASRNISAGSTWPTPPSC